MNLNLSDIFSGAGAISGVVAGAIAGALTSELRDRLKERRIKKSMRLAIARAFKNHIEKNCNLLSNYRTSYSIDKQTLINCLSTSFWTENQLQLFQHAPELSTVLSEYFQLLDKFIGKLSYNPKAHNSHGLPFNVFVSNYSPEDMDVLIDCGSQAISTLENFLSHP